MAQRVNTIKYHGKVETRDAATSLLKNAGDVVLVERGKPRLLVLRCPCGCGDDLLINLDRRTGPAWYIYSKRKGMTLYPSYWRDSGCGSHFIIWNNHIYWCYGLETDESDTWQVSTEIEDSVYGVLSDEWFISYEQVAKHLGLIPWEALQACRQLVRCRRAIADKWPREGMYKRIESG